MDTVTCLKRGLETWKDPALGDVKMQVGILHNLVQPK